MHYRYGSFVLHAHHNKPAYCTLSAASNVARTEPALSQRGYNIFSVTITVLWTVSSDEIGSTAGK